MNIKKILSSFFSYTPPVKEHNFNLSVDPNNKFYPDSDIDKEDLDNKKIFPSLSVNLEYLKTKYNILINSDIVFREFVLNARGKQYNALLVFIDGLVDTE